MLNRMFPFIVPVLAFLAAITGIVAIGELLLAVAHTFDYDTYGETGLLAAPAVALSLVVLIGVISFALSARAAKMPPVKWPDPGPTEPVRRLDLGAGYIVGQFIFFFGLGLLLLFLILVIK
ncbi:MAG: hypothetical protein U0232_22300 [Thermomicrobiales bacterium]